MPQQAIQLFRKAGELNNSCLFRKGNVIHLPEHGKVIVTGDLHGHRRNFERILRYADLEHHPETFLVLQEIIHGGPEDDYGGCLSYQLLYDALEYKLRFPYQVHLILGNHDTAVVCDTSVLKAGKEMNLAMKTAMRRHYKAKFQDVEIAMADYMMTQPLAVCCANRIWISHSMPTDGWAEEFDISIFDRPYTLADVQRPNSVYQLMWGRRQSEPVLQLMAQRLDVDVFILGHQPQEIGWTTIGQQTLIVASEHDHGCLLTFDLSRSYTVSELVDRIIPLASIA
jgi:predicted phosphodiesterase